MTLDSRLLDILACPIDKGPLFYFADEDDWRVWIGDTLSQETPLYTAESVAKGTIPQRALDAIEELALGWLRG